jgi:precorrin-6B methylase 1
MLMEKHADLSWASMYDFAERAADLKTGSADVAAVALWQLPYPLPESVQIVALLEDDYVLLSGDRRPHLRARFYADDVRCSYGKVWLVGMGPGDPELMTLKAEQVLRRADVIFYDSLIDSSVLARYSAQTVHVGKRKGNHTQRQDTINELLYAAARRGDIVVRLKGGDPLIFGRGGEEAEYLRRHLVPVEIIPGISAANAAAAAACVPLTKRGISRSNAGAECQFGRRTHRGHNRGRHGRACPRLAADGPGRRCGARTPHQR